MKTKDGRTITLKRLSDVGGDKNRGWQVDRVEACVAGEAVGYLNLSYIPQARFDVHYKAGILSYLDLIKGHGIFKDRPGQQVGPEPHDLRAMAEEDLRYLVCRASWSFMHKDLSVGGEIDRMTRDALIKAALDLQKVTAKLHGKDFDAFKAHHINKPMVDFIRVEGPMQRQGIARAMYVDGAKWMASKGMRLYASGLQQPEAAMAWKSMEGWTSLDGKRRYLDIAKIVIEQADRPLKAPRQVA